MDATSISTAASSNNFPWLSLIVLLPSVGALIIPFLPQNQDENPYLFRNLAIGFLASDFIIILLTGLIKTRLASD